MANFDLRVSGLESRIDRLEARMDARFTMLEAKMDSRFATVTWMIGVILTLLILVLGGLLGLLWKLFPAGGLS